jgi:hypothetical protein
LRLFTPPRRAVVQLNNRDEHTQNEIKRAANGYIR